MVGCMGYALKKTCNQVTPLEATSVDDLGLVEVHGVFFVHD